MSQGKLLETLYEVKEDINKTIEFIKVYKVTVGDSDDINQDINHLALKCQENVKNLHKLLELKSELIDSKDCGNKQTKNVTENSHDKEENNDVIVKDNTNNKLHQKKDLNNDDDDFLTDLDFDDFFESPVPSKEASKPSKEASKPSKEASKPSKEDVSYDSQQRELNNSPRKTSFEPPDDFIDPDEEERILNEIADEKMVLKDNTYDERVDDKEVSKNDLFDDDDDFDEDMLKELETAEKSILSDEEPLQFDETNEADSDHQPADQKYLEVLKQYFGYSTFRPMQWKIINSVLNDKKDNCVIMATGYGKSLTFQFPSVYTKRTSIIISPLISLMEDQVHGLQASNIPACFLGSAQTNSGRIMQEIFEGKYRLVYVTPEFASGATDDFKRLASRVGIDLIAIDEAHCVSQWGHDFRSAYRSLGNLKKNFPSIPVLAVTATATHEVQRDICRSLCLVQPQMTCTGFDRPNLFLTVKQKIGDVAMDFKEEMRKEGGKYHFDGPTIIYCQTKKKTEDVTAVLRSLGVSCLTYHASISLSGRKDAHHQFLNDQIQAVVATIAFGMGIDKPDVRKVIHYGAPKDIESYYQEVGRGGRDGQPSQCIVFFGKGDFSTSRHFLSTITSEKFRDHKLKMLAKMEQYLSTSQCRRRILLSYFETGNLEEIGGTENCCDNCRQKIMRLRHGMDVSVKEDEERDYTKEALDLFKAIEETGEYYGLAVPAQVLGGSATQKVQRFKGSKVFGSGKYRTQKFWNALGKSLIHAGFLVEKAIQGGFGNTVGMTGKARSYLRDSSQKLTLIPSRDLMDEDKAALAKKVSISIRPPSGPLMSPPSVDTFRQPSQTVSQPLQPLPVVDEKTRKLETDLYSKLLRLRNEISQETGFTPHNIASNRQLLDMAKLRPCSHASLLRVEDFSEVKAQRFGSKFTALISAFCSDNSLDKDNFPDPIDLSSDDMNSLTKDDLFKLSESVRQSYILFQMHKHSVEEVASKRGFKVSTIVTHMCDVMKAGLEVDIRRLGVPEKVEQLITQTIWAPPLCGVISSLTRVKDQLPLYVEYNQIKLVIARLVSLHGQETNDKQELVLSGAELHQQKQEVQSLSLKRDGSPSLSPPASSSKVPKTSPGVVTVIERQNTPQSKPTIADGSMSTSQSWSQDSEDSQSGTQAKVKKLPAWMSTGNKPVLKKKMKKSSLFK